MGLIGHAEGVSSDSPYLNDVIRFEKTRIIKKKNDTSYSKAEMFFGTVGGGSDGGPLDAVCFNWKAKGADKVKTISFYEHVRNVTFSHGYHLNFNSIVKTKPPVVNNEVDDFKLTLENGQVISNNEISNGTNEGVMELDDIKYIFLDSELVYGSTLEVKYRIPVRNDGDMEELRIAVIVPDGMQIKSYSGDGYTIYLDETNGRKQVIYEKNSNISQEEVVYLILSKLLSSTDNNDGLKTTVEISYRLSGDNEWQILPPAETQEIRIVPPFGKSNGADYTDQAQSGYNHSLAKIIIPRNLIISLLSFALITCAIIFTVTLIKLQKN